ncbi:MAG: hypothetical protein JSW70_08725 [Syntrophobacterales bacterium]|nr:MAG: hypothetical protein JSW70_08725 [Syntrophobacterales bacterium]
MKPVYVEVIAKVLTTYDHCYRCELIFDQVGINRKIHRRDVNEYPEEAKEEFLRLSDWIRELAELYRHRILIRVIDAQSPMGIFKSIRHRAWNYPAFIVERKDKYGGWNREMLEALIDRHL